MTQAEQPVQSPEVTTSVNSSAHCGFSGGIDPPYSAAAPCVRLRVGSCPRSSRSSTTAAFAEQALGRPIARGVDGRTRATAGAARRARPGCGRRWSGASFTAARRRGKLLLLDTDGGPTLGVRFGMTGRPGGRRREALDRLRYGPGVFDEKWVRCPRRPSPTAGTSLLHDPRRFGSLELAPDEDRLGPDALAVTRPTWAPPWRRGPPVRRRPQGPPDGPGAAGGGGQPAGRRDPVAGRRSPRGGARRSTTPSCARCTRPCASTLRQLGRRGGSHMGDLMERAARRRPLPARTAPSCGAAAVGGRTTWWCPQHQF